MGHETKVCTKCGVEKQLNEFYKDKLTNDGFMRFCKQCNKEYCRKRYNDNKEKIAERNKQRYNENKEKFAERNKQRYIKNREKMLEYAKQYRNNNKEKLYELNKQYRNNNKESLVERKKQYYNKNIDKILKNHSQYYNDNKEKALKYRKQYVISNPEKIREFNRNRRAREKNAPGKNTRHDIAQLLVLQKSKCAVCRCSINNCYHVDHIVPLAKGGSNDKFNLQLLCQPCNQSKHAKDPIHFMQQRGFLL